MVEVDYGEGSDVCDPGKWLAVIVDIDENRIDVQYFYEDAEPELATLVKAGEGGWLDYNAGWTTTMMLR